MIKRQRRLGGLFCYLLVYSPCSHPPSRQPPALVCENPTYSVPEFVGIRGSVVIRRCTAAHGIRKTPCFSSAQGVLWHHVVYMRYMVRHPPRRLHLRISSSIPFAVLRSGLTGKQANWLDACHSYAITLRTRCRNALLKRFLFTGGRGK